MIQSAEACELVREDQMKSDGIDRFNERLKNNTSPSTLNNPQKLITEALSRVADAIRSRIHQEENSGVRNHCWYQDIKGLDRKSVV